MPRTAITGIVVMLAGAGVTWWWLASRPHAPGPGQVSYERQQRLEDGLPAVPAFAVEDKCVACHQRETPAIVVQWARSEHAAHGHSCMACHGVPENHPMASKEKHYEVAYISRDVTPKMCAQCHAKQTEQFHASRHSIRAWVAMTGFDDIHDPRMKELYESVVEIPRKPEGDPILPRRNALYKIEGPLVTPAACQRCHSIGQPQPDGSAGRCSACHGRHEFSLEQARKPETCNNCHIGPDHPQFEIYMESKHGIQYATSGHHWNWDEPPGRLDTIDFPAPTCQICHMSGFGPEETTHDVGDRLSLFLHEPVTEQRPYRNEAGQIVSDIRTPVTEHPGRKRMQNVCRQCHSEPFILDEYKKGDDIVTWTNQQVTEATKVVQELRKLKLITPEPFDERIEFTAFDLWHHWGRTAKFGAFMQGADYSQWHGAYELLKDFAELREHAAELKHRAGVTAASTQPDHAAVPADEIPLIMRADAGHGPLPREGGRHD